MNSSRPVLWMRAAVGVLLSLSFCDCVVAVPPTLAEIAASLDAGDDVRIVCFGDSITGAYYHTGSRRAWPDWLREALMGAYPQAQLKVFNAGISGHTTVEALARLERDVLARQPQLVVMNFGMNDVTRVPMDAYRQNLQTIIQKSGEAGAAVVLVTPNTVHENQARPNSKLEAVSQIVRDVAAEADLKVVDWFQFTSEQRQNDSLGWQLTMSDDIHPNRHGHAQLAELVATAIAGRECSLAEVPALADSLQNTARKLAVGEPVHLVAMPPFDAIFADALKREFPNAAITVTAWPVSESSLAELVSWGDRVRGLKPDLVVPAVPWKLLDGPPEMVILKFEAVLNRCFPFGGNAWDVVPVHPAVLDPSFSSSEETRRIVDQILTGKDVRVVSHLTDSPEKPEELVARWVAEQLAAISSRWPNLPQTNATVTLPAQEWPHRPGPRTITALVHYPGKSVDNINASTGLMLTLHNWGGHDCVGTADPQTLADTLNVVAICVNYCQSGRHDAIEAPEPYDFGYLQGLDALRALWWMQRKLHEGGREFADGCIFSTGGSGGGNVTLNVNKLAPRTFTAAIDMCGMAKLSDDIAFNLPGGSSLNARWSNDPANPYYLSPDAQQLRFLGHPDHVSTMKSLGQTCRLTVVHGVDDATCPFADKEEMVAAMQAAGLDVTPRYISKGDLDGEAFTSSGHALGNRTKIAVSIASQWLATNERPALIRPTRTDFDLRDERVRYATPNGVWIISYAAGFPVGRFEPNP